MIFRRTSIKVFGHVGFKAMSSQYAFFGVLKWLFSTRKTVTYIHNLGYFSFCNKLLLIE